MATSPTTRRLPVEEVQAKGEAVAQKRWFEWLARFGFAARGVTYLTMGVLSVEVATGSASNAGQQGAFATLARQPFGGVLLTLVAIGLAGYAVWRLVHAAVGRGPERSDSRFERFAALGSGIAYIVLCAVAVKILLGSGSSSGGSQKPAAGVLGWPGGTWLVGAAGVVLIGVAAYQGYRGVTRDFLKDAKTEEMRPGVRNAIESVGAFGHLARAGVFGLVGAFLISAAVNYDPNNAVGLDGALAKLAHRSYGPFLLGLVAAGLVAFGLYSLTDARYRRI